MFRWPVPWHEIAFLLVGLAHQPNHADVDRAWRQVDESFRRHDNDDFSLGGGAFPAWRAIERLCDQAMHAHPDRNHAGTWYVRRLLDGRQTSPPVPGSRHDSASPKGLFPGSRDGDEDGSLQSDQPSDAVFGDVNMFGSMQSDNMFELSQYFAEPGAVGQFGVTPPEVYSGWNDVSSYRLP